MSVRINVNEPQIRERVDHPLSERGMEMLCSQILRDCNDYCKWDSGTLVASSLIHSRLSEGLLIWQTPYAARQYYEIQTAYTTEGHPKATWRWCEVAKNNHQEDWGRQAAAIARLYG